MSRARTATPPRILVVGGGYVGMYTALRLLRRLRSGEATVTVVDPRSYMTYQPFLPEAAGGAVSARHVVVPLRRVLRGAEVVTGRVTGIDHAARTATVAPLEGQPYPLGYDVLVSAVGAVSRTLPVPGLAEWATGFRTVEEAIQLRNRVESHAMHFDWSNLSKYYRAARQHAFDVFYPGCGIIPGVSQPADVPAPLPESAGHRIDRRRIPYNGKQTAPQPTQTTAGA